MKILRSTAVILAFLAPVSLEAQNSANQLEIQNCGGYAITKVFVQAKVGDDWEDVRCWGDNCSIYDRGLSNTGPKKGRLNSGQALCYDMSSGKQWGGLYRLKVKIAEGETKKTDDTQIDSGADKRRVFRMKGTTQLSNRPKSRGYKNTVGSAKCGANGTKSQVNCTPISGLDATAAERFGRRDALRALAVG